ncbi:MAG: hypothetical protein ACYC5K_12825 [Saccharofermentanales bacterium]
MADPMKNAAPKEADGVRPVAESTDRSTRTAVFKEYFKVQEFDALMEGVIWSEVLGLPLCKRKGRSIRR